MAYTQYLGPERSQGSQQINEILTRAFKEKEALPNWKIVHQVGSLDKKLLEESYKSSVRYELVEYINNMGEIYADTDMVISRAGAMTLSEICEHNIPSILIPLLVGRRSSVQKCIAYASLRASELIESDINNSDRLFELLIKMEKDNNKRDFMASASAKVFPKSSAKLIYAKINESPKYKLNKIHFIGIGGSGMSGIAEVLSNLGYVVTGSDQSKSSNTERLESLGIRIYYQHHASNLQDVEMVVKSTAIKEENAELIEAKKRFIPILARAEMLSSLMNNKRGIAIAGTHGKTTTTSLVASIMTNANLDQLY